MEAGYRAVKLSEKYVEDIRQNVIGDIGEFGGLYSPWNWQEMSHLVLVKGCNRWNWYKAPTRLFIMDKHGTIGQRLCGHVCK